MGLSEYKITSDLFFLPNKIQQNILYAPLAGFACVVNEDVMELLSDLENLKEENLSNEQKEFINYLVKRNVINGTNIVPKQNFSSQLSPSKLTLFPTDNCNLNCIYCYASSHSKNKRIMDWEIALNAVEYYLDYIKKVKKPIFELEFHGGGEPFLAWEFIKQIVDYTENRCLQESIDLQVFASTNGILNEKQLEWIHKHFESLIISFDVLPQVQNYHRNNIGLTGSFDHVNKTIKFLDDKKFKYGIRCTVSNFNLELLEETLDFVINNYDCKLLFLEPAYLCGSNNCLDNNLMPDMYRFAELYKKLEPIAMKHGLYLGYSGAKFDRLSSNFCYVGTDDFAVTVDGYLTNCWQVTNLDNPLSDTFIFGKILPKGKISYDSKKLNHLRSLSVLNYEYCSDCFAKWHCAGDCVTKLGHNNMHGNRDNARCETNRQLISYRITKLLESENYYEKI